MRHITTTKRILEGGVTVGFAGTCHTCPNHGPAVMLADPSGSKAEAIAQANQWCDAHTAATRMGASDA